MKPHVIILKAGFTNVYLLEQEGTYLLVDTGSRNQTKNILDAMGFRGIKPEDLNFIFLTHTHYDHAGSVAGLKIETDAKVIVHRSEVDFLKDGYTRIPKGTSFFYKLISNAGRMSRRERKIGWYKAVTPDIVFDDTLSLNSFGLDAEIIHTPGHTIGSSSIILEDRAIVGDAMFNFMGTYYPGFANDEPTLRNTWRKLLALDVEWYYPSHGKRISKEKVIVEARKRKIF